MTPELLFSDREAAGTLLAAAIREQLAPPPDALVLGLVRGGAVIAKHAAAGCQLAWDIFIVRKIGAPHQPEYALGAYAETGQHYFNQRVVVQLELSPAWQAGAVQRAAAECQWLHDDLRGAAPRPDLAGRYAILVDDGMATGLTMQVALGAVRASGASQVCAAVPVLADDALDMLRREAVPVAYLACPPDFRAVGQYYRNFTPVTTATVRQLLAQRVPG